jgi:Cd2+/Zn2+-exporting ATPase
MATTSNLSIDNNNHKQKAYSINIHCANCAAKIERKINELSDVDNATISILTKQLTLTAKNPDELLPTIQKIADKIEPGTIITQLEENAPNYKEKIYLIENLDCANCGAKIEKKLNELPEIKSAQLTFATKKLKIVAQNPDVLLPQINKIANSIENGVKIINTDEASSKSHQNTKKFFDEKTIDIIEIVFGAILFIIGEFTSLVPDQYTLYLYIVAYLILGFHVLKTAITNLFHGNVFDENFLMSIATLGAFAIKEYPEAVGVMLFYRIGEYFEERATEKSRSQIMDAVDLRPETVNLLHGDKISIISAHEAKVGDILLVRAGDRIPVDGIVIEGESRLDTSPVTGEPVPIKIAPNSSITSGCLNISGAIKMKVEKPLSESMVSRILQAVENAAANKPKIDKFITRFARIYTPIVVLVATLTAIIPSLITGDWEHWIYTALTFLVISCPCALVLSVPLAFFSGIGSGSKQGILFKGGLALEALKNIKTIVMDKTGTLTHGNFTVKTINPTNNYTKEELLALCASCEKISSHPIAISIINEATKQKLNLKTTTDKF